MVQQGLPALIVLRHQLNQIPSGSVDPHGIGGLLDLVGVFDVPVAQEATSVGLAVVLLGPVLGAWARCFSWGLLAWHDQECWLPK